MGSLFDFKPLDPPAGKEQSWQERFLNSTAKSPWAIGANRSGKSECGGFDSACRLAGFNPVTGRTYGHELRGWAVGLTDELTDIVYRKITKYLGPEGDEWKWIASKKTIFHKETGSICRLKTVAQGRERFQGDDLDWAWFDEEPPLDIFNETWTRCIDRAGQIIGTMTPLNGSAWLYQVVYSSDDPDFEIHTMSMFENHLLPREEIEKTRRRYRDEDEYAIRVGGEFRLMLGKAVLHIPSIQEIQKTHVCAPAFRGRLVRAIAA